MHPANADDLITEADFVADGRLPYWADLWPSSRVLAAYVIAQAGDGKRLLELGCGSGLVASAAAVAGYEVTATDYYSDACAFARVNAWHASGQAIGAYMLDWRNLPSDLARWDVVVASDVLYEKPQATQVADVLVRTLSRDGVAHVADPGRLALEDFLAACRTRGLDPGEPELFPYDFEGQKQTIRIFSIRHDGTVTAPVATA